MPNVLPPHLIGRPNRFVGIEQRHGRVHRDPQRVFEDGLSSSLAGKSLHVHRNGATPGHQTRAKK